MVDGIAMKPPEIYASLYSHAPPAERTPEALVARMEKAGCTAKARNEIIGHLMNEARNDEQRKVDAEPRREGEWPRPAFILGLGEKQLATLEKAANFMETIGAAATKGYCDMLVTGGGAKPLLDDRLLDQAQRVKALASIGTPHLLTVHLDYLYSVKVTGALEELADPKVLDFAISLGALGASEYFQAVMRTGAVKELTDPRILASADAIKGFVTPESEKANRARGPERGYFRVVGALGAVAEMTDPAFLKWYAAHRAGDKADFPEHIAELVIKKAATILAEGTVDSNGLLHSKSGNRTSVMFFEELLDLTADFMDSSTMPTLARLLKSGSHEERLIAGNALYRIGGPFAEAARDQIEAELQRIYPASHETMERSRTYMAIAETFGRQLAAEFGEGNVIITVIGSTQKGLAAEGSDIDCNAYIFTDRADAVAAIAAARKNLMEETGVEVNPSVLVFKSKSSQDIRGGLEEGVRVTPANVSPYLVAYGDLQKAGEIWAAASEYSPFNASIMKDKYSNRALGDLEYAHAFEERAQDRPRIVRLRHNA